MNCFSRNNIAGFRLRKILLVFNITMLSLDNWHATCGITRSHMALNMYRAFTLLVQHDDGISFLKINQSSFSCAILIIYIIFPVICLCHHLKHYQLNKEIISVYLHITNKQRKQN